MVKISILLFFLRVFPDPTFRKVSWWTLGCIAFSTLLFAILGVIQILPVVWSWDGWQGKTLRGLFSHLDVIWISHAILNIVFDLWMLVLPMTQIYSLGLKPRKKIGVIAMFSTGIL